MWKFLQEREDGQHEEGEEDRLMIETDQNIAKIYNALPEDTLFILATGQGDTASCRLMLVSTGIFQNWSNILRPLVQRIMLENSGQSSPPRFSRSCHGKQIFYNVQTAFDSVQYSFCAKFWQLGHQNDIIMFTNVYLLRFALGTSQVCAVADESHVIDCWQVLHACRNSGQNESRELATHLGQM